MDVFFDLDSTILKVESLDLLIGRALSSDEEVEQLEAITIQGMNGEISFNESLKKRLGTVQLTRTMVNMLADELPNHITDGMVALVEDLQSKGHTVHLLTGGFMDYLKPTLDVLGIAEEHAHANTFLWENGEVIGFNNECPLAHSGGKAVCIKQVNTNPSQVIMIGDGATDLEAFTQGACEHFIGYGLHAVRQKVESEAPYFVTSIDTLKTTLNKLGA